MTGGIGYTLTFGPVPAPATIVRAIRSIEVDVSTEEAGVLHMRLGLSRTRIGDWRPLDVDPFRPLLPVSLRLRVRGVVPETVINAFVMRQEPGFSSDPGRSELAVTAVDRTHFMNLQEKTVPWTVPDAQIAGAIFQQNGVPQVVTSPTAPRRVPPEGETYQRTTDIRFLRGLARLHGFECFVQPDPVTGVDVGYFATRRTIGFRDAVLTSGFGGGNSNVEELSLSYEMTEPTAAALAGIDAATKIPFAAPAAAGVPGGSAELPMGLEPAGLRVAPPPTTAAAGHAAVNAAEAQVLAQSIANRSSWSVVASGRVCADVGVLRPGGRVNLRGVGRLFNGAYTLTRVTHRIAPGSYEQRFEARRNAVGMTGAEVYADL